MATADEIEENDASEAAKSNNNNNNRNNNNAHADTTATDADKPDVEQQAVVVRSVMVRTAVRSENAIISMLTTEVGLHQYIYLDALEL